jgi:SagB-type dehydrogenase family enzyme
MRLKRLVLIMALLPGLTCKGTGVESRDKVSLPGPKLKGGMSLEGALSLRRSVRAYSDKALRLEQVSQVLWAGDGITGRHDYHRAAPSAGGLHPLELYIAVKDGGVKGLSGGVYHYISKDHRLELVKDGERNSDLAQAALGQMWMQQAPVIVVVAADYSRTTAKYGQRGIRYVHIDAGCASENMMLQAVALGLSTCPVGAFRDKDLAEVINLPSSQKPLLTITIGYK